MQRKTLQFEPTENEIQRAVFKHLELRGASGVFAFHPKNGNRDMRGRGAGVYTGLGVRPGIPDVIIFRGYSVTTAGELSVKLYALELKRLSRKNKKPTDTELQQAACRAEMERCGAMTGVAYGLDEALEWLEAHGLLRGGFIATNVAG